MQTTQVLLYALSLVLWIISWQRDQIYIKRLESELMHALQDRAELRKEFEALKGKTPHA